MTVEIIAPEKFQGAVMGIERVNKCNGTILGSSSGEDYFTIDAEVRGEVERRKEINKCNMGQN